jgi:predicted DNA-binding ribbon-helix-helix protein
MRPYLNWINSQVADSDTIKTFVSGMVRGGVTYTSAANHFFQSLAAIGAKRAVVAMTGEMYDEKRDSPLLGSRLCIFAHDETIIDIPEHGVDADDVTDRVDAAARRQAAVMVEQMKTVVPDVAIKAEPALMRYWSKDAKEKQDDGRRVRQGC